MTAPPPAGTASAAQQPGGLRTLLPVAGEYAVTGNVDDHTLSVVPIGAASVAGTIQLDLAPTTVGAAPNSDTVVAADGSSSGHALAVASVNTTLQSGSIDVGSGSDHAGTLLVLDAMSGRPLQTLTVGPHLTGLAATPDGHYLALACSDPETALYAVDLFASALGNEAPVQHLGVPSGVLAGPASTGTGGAVGTSGTAP